MATIGRGHRGGAVPQPGLIYSPSHTVQRWSVVPAEPIIAEPITEPTTEPTITKPIIEPIITKPITEPIIEPIAEPVITKPIAEPVTEPPAPRDAGKAHTGIDHQNILKLQAKGVRSKQAMSIPVPVLLTFLVLSACQGHMAALLPTSTLLKESIRLLGELLDTKVSCDKMNVTNIFAGDKQGDAMEMLCKASTVALEGRSCHKQLEGIHLNLLSLVRRESAVYRAPCPVAAGNTTSLNQFQEDLHRLLRQLVKDQSLK
ncbi:interleukin-4 [Chroicocephalus ridibundus]|uniref:interleukin-4 n=1 Tax=Chroicocephalus ridibundus TaxID=1192867 RepID=UPI002FDDC0AD